MVLCSGMCVILLQALFKSLCAWRNLLISLFACGLVQPESMLYRNNCLGEAQI